MEVLVEWNAPSEHDLITRLSVGSRGYYIRGLRGWVVRMLTHNVCPTLTLQDDKVCGGRLLDDRVREFAGVGRPLASEGSREQGAEERWAGGTWIAHLGTVILPRNRRPQLVWRMGQRSPIALAIGPLLAHAHIILGLIPGLRLPFPPPSPVLSFYLASDSAIPHAPVLCWSMSGSCQSATRLRHVQHTSDEQ